MAFSTSTSTPTAVPALTQDMLRKGTYFAPYFARTVTLTNGSYTEGSGTFSLPVDLTGAGIIGTIIVQVQDLSGGGGSLLAMDSVVLTHQSGGSTPPGPGAFFLPHLNAFCRSGPDPIFPSISLAMKGQSYAIDGRNRGNPYYLLRLTYPMECWVLASTGAASGNLSSIRVMLPIPTPTFTPSPTRGVNCSLDTDR